MDGMKEKWSFEALAGSIREVHDQLAAESGRAMNMSFRLRNWLIGFYIGEYEQHGEDVK